MSLGVRVQVDTGGVADVTTEVQSRNITLKAVREGAKIVSAAAKTMAPKRSGALRSAQGIKAVKGRKGQTGSFAVQGAKTKYKKQYKGRRVVPAFYDHLVIGGTKSHGVGKGGRTVKKAHPGSKANPYRERAFRSVETLVTGKMKEVMGAELQKLFAKAEAKLKAKK